MSGPENIPLNMPPVLWKLLSERGFQSETSLEALFSPKLKSLRDPLSIIDMEKAIERLLIAYENTEAICIYGDFDLDGSSGVALLKRGLEGLGFRKISYYQPSRLSEGYGVHAEAIEKIKERDEVKVILTVDVGVTGFAAAEKAKELGISLLVTDHHLAKEELPVAEAIVNPNLVECSSGLGHLCGVGVGFFLLLGLKKKMREQGLLSVDFDMKSLLDLFVIGTLTDMVPLVDENRVLVKHGLLQLEKTKRPGLSHLLKALSLDKQKLTSQDVAIRFAPKLNALSRMDDGLLPVEIFLEEDSERAKELIESVLSCNDKRIELQGEAEKIALLQQKENLQEGFVWVWSDKMHKGVIGLVATKLSQRFSVPTFVGSVKGDKIVGSSRVPEGNTPNLLDVFANCNEALNQFGGHAAAAGFELNLDKAKEFEQLLAEYFSSEEGKSFAKKDLTKGQLSYDIESNFADITPDFMKWYAGLEPFGVAFEMPVFLFKNVFVTSKKILRGGHLKFDLRQSVPFASLQALWFAPPKNHFLCQEVEESNQEPVVVDVFGFPQWNYFAGRKTLQLVVSEMRLVN